jgi:hypothetical protein
MGTYILKRKAFTKYDETDALKRAKDSDILAEKAKKPMTNGTAIATGALGGALVGGLALGAGKMIVGTGGPRAVTGGVFNKARAIVGNGAGRFLRGAKPGLIGGAAIGTAVMLHRRGKEKQENEFYNRRLEYAKRQAMRREKADWKANMTQRDGYSY